jgi:S-DNA-T family DNA segregation ATPase FtsK/SpoIIIE
MMLMPAASGVGAVVLAVSARGRPVMAVLATIVLIASVSVGVVMAISLRSGERRRTRRARERYLDHVEHVRRQARQAAVGQHQRSAHEHPDTDQIAAQLLSPSHRAPGGDMTVRVGTGTVPLDRPVLAATDDTDPLSESDPACTLAAAEVVARFTTLSRQPVVIDLRPGCTVLIRGPDDRARAVARAMLIRLIAAHPPTELAILVCSVDASAWDWLKWLPHHQSHVAVDGPLAGRLAADSADRVPDMLAAELRQARPAGGAPRRFVVVIDSLAQPALSAGAAAIAAAGAAGATAIHLTDHAVSAGAVDHRIVLGARYGTAGADLHELTDVLTRRQPGADRSEDIACVVDEVGLAQARMLARAAATRGPAAYPSTARTADPPADVTTFDIADGWVRSPLRDELCAPIGTAEDGSVVSLDLKESAHGGIGPHGLVVGATGSGKSELLRTLLLALTLGHPPEALALLLVDFKGGATFAPFAGLPQVAGVVTNLDADATLIDRLRDALAGEIQERQELFAAAGVSALPDYGAARAGRPDLRPLPRLLVVVDEFTALLIARPDLTELFATIGRVGRSIGVFLLLATQRLDTGRLRGLESHLSYRICLRTFSEAESREAMGMADAFRLPRQPGWAYLISGGQHPRRFRVAAVTRSPVAPAAAIAAEPLLVLPFHARNGVAQRLAELDRRSRPGRTVDAPPGPAADSRGGTLLDIALDRLRTGAARHPGGRPVRPVWLPPLPDRLTLASVLTKTAGPPGSGVPFGLIDVPGRQRQDALHWDPTHGNGNLLIVGTGRSGKSTALAALITSVALHLPPAGMTVLCIDLGDGLAASVGELPHVAAVASRSDAELLRRVLTVTTARIGDRGHLRDSMSGRLLLAIDGWTDLLEADPAFEERLAHILTRGPASGVHVVLTVGSPLQLRGRLLAGFSSRIELRLADPFDSAVDRRLAATLLADRPGRALVSGGHVAQIALPMLDPAAEGRNPSPASPVEDTIAPEPLVPGATVTRIRRRWPGQRVPRLTTLPRRVTLADIAALYSDSTATGIVLGLAEDDHRPVRHDLRGTDPHLAIYGDAGSGTSTTLRTVLAQVTADPGDAHMWVIDYRRDLLRHSGSRRVWRAANDPEAAALLCRDLAETLTGRLRAARAPHTAAGTVDDIYLAVDDLDLVTTAVSNPLLPVLPFLPLGRDLGFHLLIARRAGGLARAQYEPLLQTLGDLGTPVLLLSGPATEGRLSHGLVPRPLPVGRAQWATRAGHRVLQVAAP